MTSPETAQESVLSTSDQPLSENESSERLAAERLVQARLGNHVLDFDSLNAVSNIYRAAAGVRRRAEADVLAGYKLSWGGFTILWVLWVFGKMETARLAEECDLAKGTLTGMLTTLEKRDLVSRVPVAADKRRVLVQLTGEGEATIEELFPKFNAYESQMSAGLSAAEKQELARLLRIVITNAAT